MTDRKAGYGRECGRLVHIKNKPRNFVGLVGDDGLIQKALKRQLRNCHLCSDALLRGCGADARKLIARASRRSLRKQLCKRVEGIANAGEGMREGHFA